MKNPYPFRDLPKPNPYRVPTDYFEQLPTRIMTRISAADAPAASGWLNQLIYPYRAALAGSALLFGFLGTFWLAQNQFITPPAGPVAVASLPGWRSSDLLDFLADRSELTNDDLAELTLTNTDVSADFIPATADDVLEATAEQELEEAYFN